MSTVDNSLKRWALQYLPEPWLRALKKQHYVRVLREFNEGDEPDLKIVRALVPDAATVIDLGANIGVYTNVLSELVGPRGRVLSVEPVPQTYAILTTNIESLGLANVTAINAAVSDAEGVVTMEIPPYASGGSNYYRAQIINEQGATADGRSQTNRVRVPATTLDAVARDRGSIAFIKVDVESHEEACLSGAHALLVSQKPAWLIEISGDPDDATTGAARIFQLFAEREYQPWWFDGTRLIRREAGHASTNYFFLTAKHLAYAQRREPQLIPRLV